METMRLYQEIQRKNEPSLSKIVFRSLNKSPVNYSHLWNPTLSCLVNRPMHDPKHNPLFRGHSTCVQGRGSALFFLAPSTVSALLAGIGKKQVHSAPVSSSQIKGFLSNKWQVYLAAHYITVASVQLTEKEAGYYFLGKILCSLFLFWGKDHMK